MKLKKVYACPRCNVNYYKKSWAEKCESWCRAHKNTCNLEIIKHAAKP